MKFYTIKQIHFNLFSSGEPPAHLQNSKSCYLDVTSVEFENNLGGKIEVKSIPNENFAITLKKELGDRPIIQLRRADEIILNAFCPKEEGSPYLSSFNQSNFNLKVIGV